MAAAAAAPLPPRAGEALFNAISGMTAETWADPAQLQDTLRRAEGLLCALHSGCPGLGAYVQLLTGGAGERSTEQGHALCLAMLCSMHHMCDVDHSFLCSSANFSQLLLLLLRRARRAMHLCVDRRHHCLPVSSGQAAKACMPMRCSLSWADASPRCSLPNCFLLGPPPQVPHMRAVAIGCCLRGLLPGAAAACTCRRLLLCGGASGAAKDPAAPAQGACFPFMLSDCRPQTTRATTMLCTHQVSSWIWWVKQRC